MKTPEIQVSITFPVFILSGTAGKPLRDKEGKAFTFNFEEEAEAGVKVATRLSGFKKVNITQVDLEASACVPVDDEISKHFHAILGELSNKRAQL